MKRPILISVLVLIAISASFVVPKPKYTSLNILTQLHIPARLPGWGSVDVSKELNLKDDRYNFISDAFARYYRNQYGEELLLLVLDAGNFHNPKVCYTSSGYSVKELDDVILSTGNHSFKAVALDMQKPGQGTFLIYWLCIDKKIEDWAGQKITEVWSSLFNKKKAGLMVRLEISAKNRTPEQAIALGREFIQTLSNSMSVEQREYLFGK